MAKNLGPKPAASASWLRKILVSIFAVSALGHGAEPKTKIDELDSHRGKHDYVVMFSDSLEKIEKVLERCAKLKMEDDGHAAGTQQNSIAASNEELGLCQSRADSLEQERQQLEKELLNRLIDLKADSLKKEQTIADLQKQNALQSRELNEQASRCSAQAAEAASIKAYNQQTKLEAEEDLENLKADLLEKEWTIAELQKQNADLKNLVEQIIDSSKTAEKDGPS